MHTGPHLHILIFQMHVDWLHLTNQLMSEYDEHSNGQMKRDREHTGANVSKIIYAYSKMRKPRNLAKSLQKNYELLMIPYKLLVFSQGPIRNQINKLTLCKT